MARLTVMMPIILGDGADPGRGHRPRLWLAREPYVTEGAWKNIEIKPFRLAVLDGKITP
jgi:hypothetical protein